MTRRVLVVAAAAVLVAVPLFAGPFQVALVTRGVVWATFALSVWLLQRVLNLPSFGHAAFFGVAGYAAGLAVTRWDIGNVFVALALAVAVTCVVAVPIALVASRLQSISFLLVTLAFAEMLHSLAQRWREVGGSDGLVGVIRPDAWPLPVELSEPIDYFYFSLAVLVVCVLVLLVIVRSPFGGVLAGIRESESRMSALGYNPVRYRVVAFLVSAAIAGAAGVVYAYLNRFVNPEDLGALVSARGLLIVVIAGSSLWGTPVVAIGLTLLEDTLSSQTARWLGVLGIVYIAVALMAGESPRLRAAWARIRQGGRRRAPAAIEEAAA
jgi:branched-chain amino acid transport system permease protein